MSVDPNPPGYRTITPQLSLEGADAAIAFYQQAFGAEVQERAPDPTGTTIWHAALRIGDSVFFVNDVFPDMGGIESRSTLWLYVPDVDASFKRAVDAGAKVSMPLADMFWGDRLGQVVDPFGQKWNLATRKKEVGAEELKAASEAFAAQMKKK
jgi:uncharacterized glyoxalase superfamily protein PhnB